MPCHAMPWPPLPGRNGVRARLEQQEVLPREVLIGEGIPANGRVRWIRGSILMKWQKSGLLLLRGRHTYKVLVCT